MPTAREDYLIRLIQQLGEILRRLRGRLAGRLTSDDIDDVEKEAGRAIASLLGPQAALLRQLDETSAVRLVGDANRVALWTQFLRVQAEAHRADGKLESSQRLTARADALDAAARSLWPPSDTPHG